MLSPFQERAKPYRLVVPVVRLQIKLCLMARGAGRSGMGTLDGTVTYHLFETISPAPLIRRQQAWHQGQGHALHGDGPGLGTLLHGVLLLL